MIKLTLEELKIFLNYNPDTGLFTRNVALCNKVKVGDVAGATDGRGYVKIRVNGGKPIRAHRLAWFYVYGYWPECIDHIDGNTLNNCIANLREVTRKQNAENRKKNANNRSGFQGVYWVEREGKYKSQVCHNGEMFHLGTFVDSEEAAKAAREFRNEHFTHNDREVSNG